MNIIYPKGQKEKKQTVRTPNAGKFVWPLNLSSAIGRNI